MNCILHGRQTVKAIRVCEFGGPETLRLDEVPLPEPAEGDVLVCVHAAGVNPYDWKMREGLLGPLPMPRTLGCDVSGVIEALGPGVTDFFVGQPVFGHSGFGGGFAEVAVMPARGLAPKPLSLDDLEAAAIPMSGLTAWQALFEIADLRAGARILIHGGAGGVGTYAVQLAHRAGARVVATASCRNLAYLRLLGAHEAVDYRAEGFGNSVEPVDVILDLVGGETQDRLWPLLKPRGYFISTVSAPSQEKALERQARAMKMQTKTNADELTLLSDLIESGEIKVMVDRVLPLWRAPEALELIKYGDPRGKIVLTVS